MADRHKNRGLTWRPPGELLAWVRTESERWGGSMSDLVTGYVELARRQQAAAEEAAAHNRAMEARDHASRAYACDD